MPHKPVYKPNTAVAQFIYTPPPPELPRPNYAAIYYNLPPERQKSELFNVIGDVIGFFWNYYDGSSFVKQVREIVEDTVCVCKIYTNAFIA